MKVLGYILAGLGLLGVVGSSGKVHDTLPLIKLIPTKYMIIGSIILLAVGVVFLMGKSKVEHAAEEVPIYEGTGRNRKIVGYQKAK